MVKISVIVPVFNHWELVPKLISALHAQTLDCSSFELLLVDNGSSYIPSELVLPRWAKLIKCDVPGSYSARNEGVRMAKGQLLAFTDADCIPSPNWLSLGWQSWSSAHKMTLLAGGVRVEPADWKGMTGSEMYDVALGLPQWRYVQSGYAVTANLFVPKQAFEQIGFFDAKRFSGGDAEFCRRSISYGWHLSYCSEAQVSHPARRSIEELMVKQRRIVGGKMVSGSLSSRIQYVGTLFFPPVRAWAKAMRAEPLSISQKFIVCAVALFLKWIALREVVRLALGSAPERR